MPNARKWTVSINELQSINKSLFSAIVDKIMPANHDTVIFTL